MSQNNFPSWITLALVIMVGCVVAGMMLGFAGPLDRDVNRAKVQITETQAAMITNESQFFFGPPQTQQAVIAQPTNQAAAKTALPLLIYWRTDGC